MEIVIIQSEWKLKLINKFIQLNKSLYLYLVVDVLILQ